MMNVASSWGQFLILPCCLSLTSLILVSLTLSGVQVLGVGSDGVQIGSKTSHETAYLKAGDTEDFCFGQAWCSNLDQNERLALEAIRTLHRQLDDDNNGSIDLKESNGFLREELNYQKDYEKRQQNFHRNNDNQISVRNLWQLWISSNVHNWTTQQTVDWLSTSVGLPQYEPLFLQKSINGTFLPRLAANQHHFLSQFIGIRDPRHKQKVALKAQDVVLFGPPKEYSNPVKDIILTSLLMVALTVCWIVYRRYRVSQRDLIKMMKEMESLTNAEEAYKQLQEELEKTKTLTESLQKSSSNGAISTMENGINQSEELERYKSEANYLRQMLADAEVELADKCWLPPPALRHFLQLTYELETRSYNHKKSSAEKQLRQARDACMKLKEKSQAKSLIYAFVAANSRHVDEVDKAIIEAKTSLNEVTYELKERMNRWKQIESLVNFPIMNNPGLNSLEGATRSLGQIGRSGSSVSSRSSVIRPNSILNDSRESLVDEKN